MSRQSIIRINAVFEIPYDRKLFGATGEAEAKAKALGDAVQQAADDAGAKVEAFVPFHTTVEAPK